MSILKALPLSATIHATAVIHPNAQLAEGVVVHPYVVIGEHCSIGEGTVLHAHSQLMSHVTLGAHCEVFPQAVLGGPPQDAKYKGESSWVEIGDNTTIRECATVHRGTGEETVTRVGAHCLLMAYSHVGHNSQLSHHVTLANSVQIAGYVSVEEFVVIGGNTVVHQGVNIGAYAMVGGASAVRKDVSPFGLASGGDIALLYGLNIVGLRRNGFNAQDRAILKEAYKHLFREKLPLKEALTLLEANFAGNAHIERLITFAKASKRGMTPFCREEALASHDEPG
jgi:UDP-N-acetylglucosamine acyltransferase